MTLALALPSP